MTIPLMSLNGQDIRAWGLTPLDGTINTLFKPAPMKALVTNENAYLHGSQVLSQKTVRRYKKQDLSLLFYIRTPSLTDLHTRLQDLVKALVEGIDGTGINTLTIPEIETTYRLIYEDIDKYNRVDFSGKATISIKFTEPNPNNRTMIL